MTVYFCFDEDNDPDHESPIRIDDAEDPIDAAEMAAEMLDETGDLLDCREICVETEDESDGGSSWMLYVVAEMVRDYRARLTLPDFVSDPSDDDPSSDEMPT